MTTAQIDRTECPQGSYRVGGRILIARRTLDGWEISSPTQASPSDEETLRAYLEGPRQVRVCIFRRIWPQNETSTIAALNATIVDAPGPDDFHAWNGWAVAFAKTWLRDQPQGFAHESTWSVLAVDLDATHLAGFEGLWCLSREVALPVPPSTVPAA